MNRLIALAAVSATMMLGGCITVIDADHDDLNWRGENAQPFDGARAACLELTGDNQHSTAFITCMADKGWTRG